MCGFSQRSYDRIHKFNFDRIRGNISTIVSCLRSLGYKKYIEIGLHVYRFNTDELRDCQRFGNDLGVVLFFYDAFLNDWWQFEEFLRGTLPDERRREILDDLFIDEKWLRSAPEGWRCPQWQKLIIDERGEVPVCCCLPNNHPSYSLGTVDNGITQRLLNRPNLPICKTCIESGMAYRFHDPLRIEGESTLKWQLRFMMMNWRRLGMVRKMSLERNHD